MLNSDDWAGAIVYIYRDAAGTPTGLNLRNWSEEDRVLDGGLRGVRTALRQR
jgi:hypothetical protein